MMIIKIINLVRWLIFIPCALYSIAICWLYCAIYYDMNAVYFMENVSVQQSVELKEMLEIADFEKMKVEAISYKPGTGDDPCFSVECTIPQDELQVLVDVVNESITSSQIPDTIRIYEKQLIERVPDLYNIQIGCTIREGYYIVRYIEENGKVTHKYGQIVLQMTLALVANSLLILPYGMIYKWMVKKYGGDYVQEK